MKPKVSPTSPKANKKPNDEISSLYQDSLKTIDKPVRNSSTSTAVFLILVLIVGFISGFIGQFILLTYGS